MKFHSVKVLLETMCEYNTVKINHTFTTETGESLSVRCLPGTTTFEISQSSTNEVIQNDSIEETTGYIVSFLASADVSINS